MIIPAAGRGSRFGSPTPKQYLQLGGKAILLHTVERFSSHPATSEVVVAVSEDERERVTKLLDSIDAKNARLVIGGETRQRSVLNALETVSEENLVAVHDAVRPFVSTELFERTMRRALELDGALPVLTVNDTLHEVENDLVLRTHDRSQFALAQTPQIFRASTLRAALLRAVSEQIDGTDEAAIVARFGGKVGTVVGDPQNFKITHSDDLARAERLLEALR